MAVLYYLPKLKRGMGLAFVADFLHDCVYYYQCLLFNTHHWTKFQCHTFLPSQDIKQNVL